MEDQIHKNEWDINPELYQRDLNNEFVLKKDGTPKKKAGRQKGKPSRGYNFHSETKTKMAARRSLRDKERNLHRLENKVKGARERVKQQRVIQTKLDESSDKKTQAGKILTKEDIQKSLPESVKEHILNENVIFQANEGPQTEFLAKNASNCTNLYRLGHILGIRAPI